MRKIEFARKPRAYLAAPLFNDMERDFNARIESSMAPLIDVFLPQRDGGLLTKLVASGMPLEEARQNVFKKDIDAIASSDVLIAVLDGRTVDEGVSFELGYAYALGKLCIGLKTDDRVLLATGDNPMVICSCHLIVSSIDEIVDVIRSPREIATSGNRLAF
ncbi:nucleoside 2-deoxyribosyltransferase [Paraburkholderia fungorum]|uniref:nucleoside 2-deoxyribosyltransferase n=1 Tax=Paraburkholderia fungorum TaxID=134537 RepID=UPI0038BD0FDD